MLQLSNYFSTVSKPATYKNIEKEKYLLHVDLFPSLSNMIKVPRKILYCKLHKIYLHLDFSLPDYIYVWPHCNIEICLICLRLSQITMNTS